MSCFVFGQRTMYTLTIDASIFCVLHYIKISWLLTFKISLQALSKTGILLGSFPIRVSPSKTSIVPVNNQYLPRSAEEMAAVARTVYVANIDRFVERETVRDFFTRLCGTFFFFYLL